MRLLFVDESGFASNWRTDLENQPYFALAGVLLPADRYAELCAHFRATVGELGIPRQDHPIGLGSEIKAREIARGGGWWTAHDRERNVIRELMLTAPARYGGTAIVVVVDKIAHLRQYVEPADPYALAHQFLFERVQAHLAEDVNDHACCFWDQNKATEDRQRDQAVGLVREGSEITFWSDYVGEEVTLRLQIDRIVEVASGRSHESIGLQIADFFATMTMAYYRDGKPGGCGWWECLRGSLRTNRGRVEGYGLKAFP